MNIQPSLCDTSVQGYWKDHSFGYMDFCPQSVSHVQPFVTPWTVTHQAPLPVGISQARILKWVAIFFSRGSSQSRDQTRVSCVNMFQAEPFPLSYQGRPTDRCSYSESRVVKLRKI